MAESRNQLDAPKSGSMANLAGKYLTFRLANEEYGLEIMKVQEIIGLMPVTQVPRVPDYVRGVINLRGRIIPTIELRAKFGLPRVPDTDKTCIIVVEAGTAKGKVNMGIIVDEVAEVLDVGPNDVDQPPEFGSTLNTAFILGVGIVKGGVKILLDVDRVLTVDDVRAVQTIAQAHTTH